MIPAPALDPITIGGTLAHAARTWPNRDAFRLAGRHASHAQMLDEAVACARGLRGMGIGAGDHLGVFMPNCWPYVTLFHAASLIGATIVAINARYRDSELAHVLRLADIRALFIHGATDERFDARATLCRVLPELATWRPGDRMQPAGAPLLRMAIDLNDATAGAWTSASDLTEMGCDISGTQILEQARKVTREAICLVMFSSGTTAMPKACMISHRALTISGQALASRFRLGADDIIWNPLPFYHMSTMLPLAATRATGACFLAQPYFEPGAALADMETLRATVAYPAFLTLATALLAHPDFPNRDLSSLRLMLNIGPPDLLRRFAQAIPSAVQISCYGLTEGGGVCCYNEIDDTLAQRVETCGRPIESVTLRIVDPLTKTDAPPGKAGEIWIRGDCLFSGYYKDPSATDAIFAADGWLRSGDIGMLDPDGRLIYRGRSKDMLKIGGENVAAVEIESFLSTHPAIKVAQIVGIPDDRLVEVAAAYIELQPGASLTGEDVVRHCAHRIASFKIPRVVHFVTDWPMSATKIQKFRLKEHETSPHGLMSSE